MDYPNVSILVPTYNRNKFLNIFLENIINLDYDKNLLELCILDDGSEPFIPSDKIDEVKDIIKPITLKYIFKNNIKMNIGVKRNKLVKLCTHKICINMDDDDIYFPEYIKHSVDKLKNKKGLVGSNDMYLLYPNHKYDIALVKCIHKRQINEGTMCYTKKHWRNMGGFLKTNLGEGIKMIDNNDKNVELTDINKVCMQIVHHNNTYKKDKFYKFKININFKDFNNLFEKYIKKIEILTEIPYISNNTNIDLNTKDVID
jgi:glycosyltransferase involved in cell wall biosynthesis